MEEKLTPVCNFAPTVIQLCSLWDGLFFMDEVCVVAYEYFGTINPIWQVNTFFEAGQSAHNSIHTYEPPKDFRVLS